MLGQNISNRWSAESFLRSMWVKKFNLQITFMYIHFSHYVNPPKCIIGTADIRKTFDFFGQWFVEIKLKKLSIFTFEFTNNFVARDWYKMVATPCFTHSLALQNDPPSQHKHLQNSAKMSKTWGLRVSACENIGITPVSMHAQLRPNLPRLAKSPFW